MFTFEMVSLSEIGNTLLSNLVYVLILCLHNPATKVFNYIFGFGGTLRQLLMVVPTFLEALLLEELLRLSVDGFMRLRPLQMVKQANIHLYTPMKIREQEEELTRLIFYYIC